MKLHEIKLCESHPGFITDKDQIMKWVLENTFDIRSEDPMNITNVNIHDDGTVDISGDALLPADEYFRVKFGKIDGSVQFWSDVYEHKKFKSLIGCPRYIKNDFSISHHIDSTVLNMSDGPTSVTGTYDITGCKSIVTFDYIPSNVRKLSLAGSGITSLIGIANKFPALSSLTIDSAQVTDGGLGLLLCSGFNKMVEDDYPCVSSMWFYIIEKYVGRPDDIFECQAELIEAGLEQYAQL